MLDGVIDKEQGGIGLPGDPAEVRDAKDDVVRTRPALPVQVKRRAHQGRGRHLASA